MQIEMPAEQPNWFIVWRKLVNESFQRPGKNANICSTLLKFIFVIHGGGWKLLAIILPSCYFQCGHAGMRGIFVLSGNNCKFHCSTHTWPRPRPSHTRMPAPPPSKGGGKLLPCLTVGKSQSSAKIFAKMFAIGILAKLFEALA